jgi:uncharacterized protein
MIQLANIDSIILFFALGMFAAWVKSDLEVPSSISKFLSIFLLLSLGLKGGHEVRVAESFAGFFPAFSIGLISCLLIPLVIFFLMKNRLGVANAAAISASYGSVSAVTFITARSILESEGINSSGFMVAIMALMEVPAIIISLFLYQKFSSATQIENGTLLKSIFSSKSVLLLIGGFGIALTMNESSWASISPVFQGCFKGVVAFFLLDLGVNAQRQLPEAWKSKTAALPIAIFLPLNFGILALFTAYFYDMSQGDQILIAVLAGSASYIAAPAAIRTTVPSANPSLYLALPLALTFPMNLIIGIPLYMQISNWLML